MSLSSLSPPTRQDILKWLEELWLDERIREVVDEDDWLKFVESIKSELE